TNPSLEKLTQLKQRLNINITSDNVEGAQQADILVLTVKPQVLQDVIKELSKVIQEHKPLIISVAAGVREEQIRHWLGDNKFMIVRCMPNTPALVGSGATALYANEFVGETQKEEAESILRAVGITVWVKNEEQMDVATALSGCGPAYFFLVMEALQESAEELGLDREAARLLTLQTALGASRMALESEESPSTLRQQVASRGGSTEKALHVLEEGKLRELFKQALQAAQQRAVEITKMFSEN
ncbi:MAG: pyrroline-5-carboxylate reductase, partial [Gammaproteobacteria bacterium]